MVNGATVYAFVLHPSLVLVPQCICVITCFLWSSRPVVVDDNEAPTVGLQLKCEYAAQTRAIRFYIRHCILPRQWDNDNLPTHLAVRGARVIDWRR